MMSVMAVNTLLYSNITCHESGKPLCGSFSEPEWHTSDDAFKTTLLTHRRHNKAHCKPDQAPNKRCNQLGPKRPLEGARHREGGIGEQDRRPHEHQKIEHYRPHARDGVYGGEHERREDERQECECAKQP